MSVQKLNDMMDARPNYKDKWFVGQVVDNADPLGIGRFKAQVPGLFETGDLPWIGYATDSPFGNGPGFGVYGAPAIGAQSIIRLQEGSALHPICVGFLKSAADANPLFADPNVWGFVDPSGTQLVVDTASKTYEFSHVSGASYSFGAGGELQVTAPGGTTFTTPTFVVDAESSTFTGNVQVQGTMTVEQLTSMLQGFVAQGSGSGGATGHITGNIIHEGGNFSSNGVILHIHIHTDSIGGNTSGPRTP